MSKKEFEKIKCGLDEAIIIAPYVAEIERLRAENEKLRAALKPFAVDDWVEYATFTGHDLRRAAAALKEDGNE